jgi:hypothetical protein
VLAKQEIVMWYQSVLAQYEAFNKLRVLVDTTGKWCVISLLETVEKYQSMLM